MTQPQHLRNTVRSAIFAMEANGVDMFDVLTAGKASSSLTPYVQTAATPAQRLGTGDSLYASSIEHDDTVSTHELAALDRHIATLEHLRDTQDISLFPSDAIFLERAIQGVKQGALSLPLMVAPLAVNAVRNEIKRCVADAWMSACYAKLPRFYTDGNGSVSADETSVRWSSSFFKIAKAEPALRCILQGGDILDPYAGSGVTAYIMLAKGLARTAILSDISYVGGRPIESDKFYDFLLNGQMIEALYSDLPQAYQHNLQERTHGQVADARALPFSDNIVDFVVTDPPYGVDCPHGDETTFVQSLPELLRVARYGAVVLIPVLWQEHLERNGYQVSPLTHPLTSTHVETAYAHIMLR